ncbi:glucan ABC transporter ATP-binding protein/ permease [Agrobacterium salinitolerans]|nr:glucan ABC transporter ATP-binding protein/ permease [Agrobacterium salinitolerans]
MTLTRVYLRSLAYLAAYRWRVSAVVLANIALACVAILEPILFGRIIDAVSGKGGVEVNLALWGGLALFNIVAYVLVARQADRLAHSRRAALLSSSYSRLVSMPLSWHNARGNSNVLHTLLRASDTLFSLWLDFMRSHLATAVALAMLVPTALMMDLRLSAVLFVLGAVYWLVQSVVMKKTRAGQASVEKHYHDLFSHISDTISGVSVVQSYNRAQAESETLKTLSSNLLKAQFPVLDWWALASALNRMASTISMMVILLIGTALVMRGEMTVGEIIAFIGFANLLIGKLETIRCFVSQIFEARSKLEDFLALEADARPDEDRLGEAVLGSVAGRVEFEDVSFDFVGTTQGIRDVSFSVEPGQTVAIVGATGAGKTTLVNLLQRVHEPQSGRILVDGKDIAKIARAELRENIATVFQDAGLLNRTIGENVGLGRQGSSEEEIEGAIASAAATDFVASRPDGVNTVVGDRGNRLSGGERQRLAIARAILKSAPILVLDEATSALDVETERQVQNALDHLTKDRTTFVIAHRLSTIRDADLVILMDHGRIAEIGSYEELATRGGRFTHLLFESGLLGASRAA